MEQKLRSFGPCATFERSLSVGSPQVAPAITDLLEAGRTRAREALAERMAAGFGPGPARERALAGRLADRPWESLAPEVADALRPELPALADEIVAAVSEGVPDYARPLEGPFGRALRSGVEEALRQFVTAVEDPEAARATGRETYVNRGRGEMRAGRGLDALLAAYRIGARVAWRRLAAAGERAGLRPATLYALAEAIFAYIDELSADSIEGYAREQAAAAGAFQRRRQRLAGLLVREPAAAPGAVEAAAADAGWPLPRETAALAVEGEEADRLAVRLGPDALVAPLPSLTVAVMSDPAAPGRTRELAAALRGRRAVLGPVVGWQETGLSFARAHKVLELVLDGALEPPGSLVVASEHQVELVLGGDRRLARDLAERALAPLEAETELSRERLGSTLDAWLRHRGRTEAVARALHVHPQTVRYRLARLRELFGARLDDPDARFELELALRSWALVGNE
jgi:PucR C-terminal helix-turn-helix domain